MEYNFSAEPSPKFPGSSSRSTLDKDQRTLPNFNGKDSNPVLSRSNPNEINEEGFLFNTNDPIYGNVQARQRMTRQDSSLDDDDDEGDLIEHDLLSLVQEEEQKEIPPALPVKRRAFTSAAVLTPHENNNHLDINLEPTSKLVHPGGR